MATGMATPETPVGLQKLISLDCVSVRQKTTHFANKYAVTSQSGDLIFNAKEDASVLDVMLGGTKRSFHINLFDSKEQLVISLRRPFSLGSSKLEVSVCGTLVSVVRQEPTFFKPVLSINDGRDKPVLRVKGPAAYHVECDFIVQSLNKEPIGRISKMWQGLMREMFTNTDQFQIRFPLDLDVRYKAAIIGACLLIDFLYYEKH